MAVAVTTNQYLDDYETTSSTSMTLGTSGSRTLTVDTGKAFYTGMTIEVARTSNLATFSNATVTTYDSGTGQLDITLNSGGSGTGTYTDWQVTYRRSDTITISINAILTQRYSNAQTMLTIACPTRGNFKIDPANPAVPMVLNFQTASSRLQFEQNGIFETNGTMLDIYTGTGFQNQTIISGNNILGTTIDGPNLIEIETGNGTGIFKLWGVIPTVFTGGNVWAKTDFGPVEKVLFWDNDTGTLTCGDAINGAVIPYGATVRFPNIHITSAVGHLTYYSRAQLDTSPSGTAIIKNTNFSHNFYVNLNNFAFADVDGVGCVSRFSATASTGNITTKRVIANPDYGLANGTGTVGLNITNLTGRFIADNLKGFAHTNQGINIVQTNNAKITNIEGITIKRVSTTANPVTLTNVTNLDDDGNPLAIDGVIVSGGNLSLNNLNGQVIKNITYSGETDGVIKTTNAMNSVLFTNCSNSIAYNIWLKTGGVPQRNYTVNFDLQSSNCSVFNVNVDLISHGYPMYSAGTRNNIFLSTFDNPRDSLVQTGPGELNLKNIKSNTLFSNINGYSNSKFDLITGSGTNTALPNYYDFGPFTNMVNVIPTTGTLAIGPFGQEVKVDVYDIVGSSIYFNNNGAFYIETTGDYLNIKNKTPIKGITSFQNIAPTITGVNTGNFDFTFRVANAGLGDWTSYVTLNGTNLSSALSSLSGFDSDVGFDVQVKVTANTDSINQYITGINLKTNNDSSYNPVPYFKTGNRIYILSAGTYDLGGYAEEGDILLNESGGSVTVYIDYGLTVDNRGPSITVIENTKTVYITAPNIIDGSLVRLTRVSDDYEYYYDYLTSDGFSYAYEFDGTPVDIYLTVIHYNSTTKQFKKPIRLLGQIGEGGTVFLDSQEDYTIVNNYGLDPTTITEFTADYLNIQIDVDDGDNKTYMERGLIWFNYLINQKPYLQYYAYNGVLPNPHGRRLLFNGPVTIQDIKSDGMGGYVPLKIYGMGERADGLELFDNTAGNIIVIGDTDVDVQRAVVSIKGIEDKDLTQVYNNTPTIDNEAVASAVRVELTPELTTINTNLDAKVSNVGGGGYINHGVSQYQIENILKKFFKDFKDDLDQEKQQEFELLQREKELNKKLDRAISEKSQEKILKQIETVKSELVILKETNKLNKVTTKKGLDEIIKKLKEEKVEVKEIKKELEDNSDLLGELLEKSDDDLLGELLKESDDDLLDKLLNQGK